MAVDSAAAGARALPRASARLLSLPAGLVLGAIVSVSALVRLVAARGHSTPMLFPDEYTYWELARSLAESGRPLVRGMPSNFPALLEPLLAAPFWLIGDAETVYRLTQGLHAVAMSLAAIPVYLLARHLSLSARIGLAAAAVAVAAPGLVYASFVLSDPVGYPLALAAVLAGVRVLDRPTARGQLLFLAFSGLAVFARIQYAILPAVFLIAVLIVERGSLRRALRHFRLTLGLAAFGVVAAAAIGPTRVLGTYAAVDGDAFGFLAWLPTDALLLVYATGFVLVPGALVGLALGLVRPQSRAHAAFCALVAPLALGLVAEAAVIAALDAARFQERYLMTLVPLTALAFCLPRERLWARRATAGLALGLLVIAARIPLSGYTADLELPDSPTLWAVRRLESTLDIWTASLLVALVATAFALVAVADAFSARGRPFALGAALAAAGALSAGAYAFDADHTARVRAVVFPSGTDWVDREGLGRVSLLETPGSRGGGALAHLFWNRSVDSVLTLPGSVPSDQFATTLADVGADGVIRVGGSPHRRALLVATYGSALELEGAVRVARVTAFDLWKPTGVPRLKLLVVGRYYDGWLAGAGRIVVWPDASGRTRGVLVFDVSLPRGLRPALLRVNGAGIDRRVRVTPGESQRVAIQLDAPGPVALTFRGEPPLFGGLRSVSMRASEPTFRRALSVAPTLPIPEA